MSKRPRYSNDQRTAMRRRAAEAGLQAARGVASSAEILFSANPYFGVMSLPLKRAAVRYVQLSDGPILNKVKRAMDEFVVKKAYHGGFVTSQEFTTEKECAELTGCAGRVELQLPSVLASMRQFIKEMRQGEKNGRPFYIGIHGIRTWPWRRARGTFLRPLLQSHRVPCMPGSRFWPHIAFLMSSLSSTGLFTRKMGRTRRVDDLSAVQNIVSHGYRSDSRGSGTSFDHR